MFANYELHETLSDLQEDYYNRRGAFADIDIIETEFDRRADKETKYRKNYPEDKE